MILESKRERYSRIQRKREQRKKVTSACEYCKLKKIKCDDNTPCENCLKREIRCMRKLPAPRGPFKDIEPSKKS
jgi:Fungal Zn(2)-Cys(6) binuclear cluster domain